MIAYALQLAADFHVFHHDLRVLHDDPDVRAFRLTLTAAVGDDGAPRPRPGRRRGAGHDVTVAALGDLVLDVSTRPHGPIAADDDTPSANRLEAGGQAANVAAWAAAGGARARLITRRSSDPAGRMAEERVRARGVEVVGPRGPEPAGIVVSLIARRRHALDADRPRRRAAARREPTSSPPGWPASAGSTSPATRSRASRCWERRSRRPPASTPRAGAWRSTWRRWPRSRPPARGCSSTASPRAARTLVFGTRDELAYDALPAPLVVAKRGADGAGLRGALELDRPAPAAEVVDPTGAGDALAGGMLAALAAGVAAPAALDAGLALAARCVGRRGAMPPLR